VPVRARSKGELGEQVRLDRETRPTHQRKPRVECRPRAAYVSASGMDPRVLELLLGPEDVGLQDREATALLAQITDAGPARDFHARPKVERRSAVERRATGRLGNVFGVGLRAALLAAAIVVFVDASGAG